MACDGSPYKANSVRELEGYGSHVFGIWYNVYIYGIVIDQLVIGTFGNMLWNRRVVVMRHPTIVYVKHLIMVDVLSNIVLILRNMFECFKIIILITIITWVVSYMFRIIVSDNNINHSYENQCAKLSY